MISQYIYGNRAVAFLNVLGFQNKLKEFENEAVQFYAEFIADNSEGKRLAGYFTPKKPVILLKHLIKLYPN